MDWWALSQIITLPVAFVLGHRFSRYTFVHIRRKHKQDIGNFIRGR